MDHRNAAGEGLEKSKEPVIRNWEKGDPCDVVAENLAKFSPAVTWKIELVNNTTGYVAKETSKQSVGAAARFLPTADGKLHEGR